MSSTSRSGEFTDAALLTNGCLAAVQANRIDDLCGTAKTTEIAAEKAPVYQLHPFRNGLAFLTDTASHSVVHVITNNSNVVVAVAKRGDVTIDAMASGDLVAHGSTLTPENAQYSQIHFSRAAVDATATDGKFMLVRDPTRADPNMSIVVSDESGRHSFAATAHVQTIFDKPSVNGEQATTSTGVTTDANSPCAVQRNDPATMAYQPSVAQVEWTVDQAVRGRLTMTRPAGYRGYGLPSYSPQHLFPLTPLAGGGSVPPQIFLGILANESNLWQASSHVSPGGYGNPLTGNIYGRSFDANGNESNSIDFANADCGYGIAQVTDGMRLGDQSATTQRAIALDYQVNIAAGLNILISKWNQLASYDPAIVMNGGSAAWIENWYAAAWAYNTGIQPNAANGNTTGCIPGPSCTDASGNWGLGWANNPANPVYPPNRHIFNSVATDAKTPGQWPYQERVLGWAAYPIYKVGGSYAQSWWAEPDDRVAAIPNSSLFCDASDNCLTDGVSGSSGSCDRADYHCWLHHSVTWKDCSTGDCGHSAFAYAVNSPEPADPRTADPADCRPLPVGAIVVDDLTTDDPAAAPTCHSLHTTGSFAFSFPVVNNNEPAHIDLHQIDGGINGHYWFTHTEASSDDTTITGAWTFPSTTSGQGQLEVHVPALGAQATQATYVITDTGSGRVVRRTVNQGWGSNKWISLGWFSFAGPPRISLSSVTPTEGADDDIAWDAVAFVPGAPPAHSYVALGDSYSAGEGLEPYNPDSDRRLASGRVDACHRSAEAYPYLVRLPGSTATASSSGNVEFRDLACSGAHTNGITPRAANDSLGTTSDPYGADWAHTRYEHGEAPQVPTSNSYLNGRTSLVTLSVGGNDVRFADIVGFCTLESKPLPCRNRTLGTDPSKLSTYEPIVISKLLAAHLSATYAAIHAAAPNATIYVVGYPRIFQANPSEGCDGIYPGDQTWMNDMADLLASTTSRVVSQMRAKGVHIWFVDTRNGFADHEVCSGHEWINGPIAYSKSGSGTAKPGAGSYHPRAAGQAEFATLLNAAIAKHGIG